MLFIYSYVCRRKCPLINKAPCMTFYSEAIIYMKRKAPMIYDYHPTVFRCDQHYPVRKRNFPGGRCLPTHPFDSRSTVNFALDIPLLLCILHTSSRAECRGLHCHILSGCWDFRIILRGSWISHCKSLLRISLFIIGSAICKTLEPAGPRRYWNNKQGRVPRL